MRGQPYAFTNVDRVYPFMNIVCMSKTITVDDETYQILKSHKFSPRESFSEVIRKRFDWPVWEDQGTGLEKRMAELLKKKKGKKGASVSAR
jgi:negative regulator of replication initiation